MLPSKNQYLLSFKIDSGKGVPLQPGEYFKQFLLPQGLRSYFDWWVQNRSKSLKMIEADLPKKENINQLFSDIKHFSSEFLGRIKHSFRFNTSKIDGFKWTSIILSWESVLGSVIQATGRVEAWKGEISFGPDTSFRGSVS